MFICDKSESDVAIWFVVSCPVDLCSCQPRGHSKYHLLMDLPIIGCKRRPNCNSVGAIVLIWVAINSQFRDFLSLFQNLLRRVIFISGYAKKSQAFSPPILFQVINMAFLPFTGIFSFKLSTRSDKALTVTDLFYQLVVQFVCFWSRYPVDGW